jgi:ATP-dependent protease ClpP protease subunit
MRARFRAEGGVTRVDIFDDIGGDPFWGGGVSASDFTASLAKVRGPVDVHISSHGGVVGDGLAIYNALTSYNGPVTTYNDGIAASIASVIMQAGSRRVMSPVSAMMIHDAWGWAEGDEAEVRKTADALAKNSDIIARAYASKAGGSPARWREAMKATTWYDADEALAAGLVDEVGAAPSQAAVVELGDLAALAPARIMARLRAAAPMEGGEQDCPTCGKPGYDPDDDGDDDSSAEGDTDHDYVTPDGHAVHALDEVRVRSIVREMIRGADKYDTEDRRQMAEKGHAMPDGSYPVADEEDLGNAIHAVGRGGSLKSSQAADALSADAIFAMFTTQPGAGKE